MFCLLLLAARTARAQLQTPHDNIPDFCASPSISSVANGNWNNPATWSPARVPGANDIVRISAGTTVDLSSQLGSPLACVGIAGQLTFSTTVSTRLWSGNVLVYTSGTLQIGTTAQPVQPNVTAEVVIANRPLDPVSDPDQYGTGFIALGKVRIHGAARTPTFARVTQELVAGQQTLPLEVPVSGWQPGDRLILPDTRHLQDADLSNWSVVAPQWEELSIQSVSSDGRTVTLASPLRFDHLGARDGQGTLNFLPHVGNLSRNVVIGSEAALGSGGTLGHIMLTHRADIDIRYALIRNMGRTTTAVLDPTTNHIGRYPLHMHHLIGPATTPSNGYQFTLIGNAIDGGTSATTNAVKWGMAVHDSHYGLIQDNVAYNWGGALIMFEQGNESFNVVDHNFVMRSDGTGGRDGMGREGGGFWFRGPNNYVRRNVAANLMSDAPNASYGFKYYMTWLGNIDVPNFKGADTMMTGEFTTLNGNNMPLLEFTDNEVYGATGGGFSYWWINSLDPQPMTTTQETLVKNLHIWHVFNEAIFHYPAAHVTFDGLVIRGKDPQNAACCGRGWDGGDYAASNIRLYNSDIQGMKMGVYVSNVGMGDQIIENTYLRNLTNIVVSTISSVNGSSWIPPRRTIVRNVTFDPWPGQPLTTISMVWDLGAPNRQPATDQLDQVFVYQYRGNLADNFQAYYTVQATQNVAGGLAPCTTTRPEVNGITCPISYVPPTTTATPPGIPTNVRIVP
jgi:hypothetical protein